MQASAQANADVAKAAAILVWILIWQLAAMGLGHGGLFLATPLQTLGALAQLAPTAAFWQRIVFSALRIMAGFLLAAAGGLLLGAAAHVGTGYGCSLTLPCS